MHKPSSGNSSSALSSPARLASSSIIALSMIRISTDRFLTRASGRLVASGPREHQYYLPRFTKRNRVLTRSARIVGTTTADDYCSNLGNPVVVQIEAVAPPVAAFVRRL